MWRKIFFVCQLYQTKVISITRFRTLKLDRYYKWWNKNPIINKLIMLKM